MGKLEKTQPGEVIKINSVDRKITFRKEGKEAWGEDLLFVDQEGAEGQILFNNILPEC